MFNDSIRGISVYSYALLNSVSDFIESHTYDEESDPNKMNFVSKNGDVYLPMNVPGGKVLNEWAVPNDQVAPQFGDFRTFRQDMLDQDVLSFPFNKGMFLPTLLKELLSSDEVYGIIIQDGDYMINPGHPLIAFMISAGLMELPTNGKIHVFNWSKPNVAKVKKGLKKKDEKFFVKYFSNLFGSFEHLIKMPSVVSSTASIDNTEVSKIIDTPFIDSTNVNIKVHEEAKTSTRYDIKSLLIPLQLAISGIATPYYGIAVIKNPTDSESCQGENYTPMLSGNLDTDRGSSWDDIYAYSGNVCTGSYSRTRPSGWLTLSRVNLDSMHFDGIIDFDESINFVQGSKMVSSNIWEEIETEMLEQQKEGL